VRILHLLFISLLLLGCAKKGTKSESNPPPPVLLYDPEVIGRGNLLLVWSFSRAEDFSSYKLYRGSSEEALDYLRTFSQRSETTYMDTGLGGDTTYWYKVAVFNQGGQSAFSNPVKAYLPGIFLYPPSRITSLSMMISWSPVSDADFDSYRLYHSTSDQVDTTSELLTISTGSSDTTFCHTGLEDNTKHYYRVYISFQGGSSKGSNFTSGLTKGGDHCFYLRMEEGSGLPEGKVTIPLTVINCASIGSFEIRLTWEKEPVDSVQIRDWPYWVGGKEYHFDYFNLGLVEVGDSVQAHLVVFCQMFESQNPPLPPSQKLDTLALFTFWLSPNWDSQPIPIHFLTKDPCHDNTISDPTGYILYSTSSACPPRPPPEQCPPNPAIELHDGQINAAKS